MVVNNKDKGKILAIDFGERRIGLAVSAGSIAYPREILDAREQADPLARIAEICHQEEITGIVIGLPLDRRGRLTAQAKKVKKFGEELRRRLSCPITFWNETLTTQEAVVKMVAVGWPRKKRVRQDALAAALILQEYLDAAET